MKTISKVTYTANKDLLPCPFCGSNSDPLTAEGKIKMLNSVELCKQQEKAQPYGVITIDQTVYFAACRKCGATGGRAVSGYNPMTKNTTTEAEAISWAVEKWNRRQGGSDPN